VWRCVPWLPVDLTRQLNLSRSALEKDRVPGARDRSRRSIPNVGVRVVELRRIEDVECLRPELKVARPIPVEIDILEQGHVHLLGSRPINNIAARIAKVILPGRHKVSSVKPVRGPAIAETSGAFAVRPLGGPTCIEQAGRHHRGKRCTRLESIDAVQLPAPDQQLGNSVGIA
jgi:hypothetical protein